MKSEIKGMENSKKEKALASHFFKFFCHHTFGTFTKSHRLTHNLNFAKEPNLANSLKTITEKEMVV